MHILDSSNIRLQLDTTQLNQCTNGLVIRQNHRHVFCSHRTKAPPLLKNRQQRLAISTAILRIPLTITVNPGLFVVEMLLTRLDQTSS
jgi:hypothetical protein